MRVLLPPEVTTASVSLSGLPLPNRTISVCQAPDLDGELSTATCRTPANGEAVNVTVGGRGRGVAIVHEGLRGTEPSPDPVVVDEVAIRYGASSREVSVRLPQIAAGESGARPTIGLTPASTDGRYRARLTWKVITVFGGTPSSGQLELLRDGSVAEQAQGGGDVQLDGTVTPPVGEVAVRVQNLGSAALVTPLLTVLLP